MNLEIKNKLFLVTGASSGFGYAIMNRLVEEEARVIAIARNTEKLEKASKELGSQVEILSGDVIHSKTLDAIIEKIGNRPLAGALINAGGPPAKSFMETNITDWDEAYSNLLRWKVEISKKLIPLFEKEKYGRLLFIESASVKQPMENLVLSTSLRLAVVGFVKTLASELAANGITANVLAPGYHMTAAVDRIFKKRSELAGISYEQAKASLIDSIPVKTIGLPDDIAILAVWLLSPSSRFVTGETITVDGGSIKHIFG
jgi:3-oxoacyl-[acyl-carrier protein] reductase